MIAGASTIELAQSRCGRSVCLPMAGAPPTVGIWVGHHA